MSDSLRIAPSIPLAQIEWKVDSNPTQSKTGPRARFTPYVDARDIARLLDEWVGPENWSDSYRDGSIGGNPVMWCTIAVRSPSGDWVTKTDVGTPTDYEAEKGLVSDAFKRVGCAKWGCGRNVYDMPKNVWAPVRLNNKGKPVATDETLPAILAQLKRLGFNDVAGRVVIPEVEESDGPAKKAPAPPRKAPAKEPTEQPKITADQWKTLSEELGALSEDHQRIIKQWAETNKIKLTFGGITKVGLAKVMHEASNLKNGSGKSGRQQPIADTTSGETPSVDHQQTIKQPAQPKPPPKRDTTQRDATIARFSKIADIPVTEDGGSTYGEMAASMITKEGHGFNGEGWIELFETAPPAWDPWLVEMVEAFEADAGAPFDGSDVDY